MYKRTHKDINPIPLTTAGVFWGTFDPPTIRHREIIKQAVAEYDLQKIIVIINDNSATKKQYKSPATDRALMLIKMFDNEPLLQKRIKVRIQSDENQSELTYDKLKLSIAATTLCAIVGQDSFEKYPITACQTLDRLIVVPRDGNDRALQEKISISGLTNTTILKTASQELSFTSSTIVRNAIKANNHDVAEQHLIPAVKSYIDQQGFFKPKYDSDDMYTAKHYMAVRVLQRASRHYLSRKQEEATTPSASTS